MANVLEQKKHGSATQRSRELTTLMDAPPGASTMQYAMQLEIGDG